MAVLCKVSHGLFFILAQNIFFSLFVATQSIPIFHDEVIDLSSIKLLPIINLLYTFVEDPWLGVDSHESQESD